MTGGVLALLEAGVDPDFAAFERAEARRASAPPAASAVAPRRPHLVSGQRRQGDRPDG